MRQDITGVTIYIYLALASNTKAHIQNMLLLCFNKTKQNDKKRRKKSKKNKIPHSYTADRALAHTYIYEEDIKKHPSHLVVSTFY